MDYSGAFPDPVGPQPCQRCGQLNLGRHEGSRACKAQTHANRMTAMGFVRIESNTHGTMAKYAIEILHAFGLPARLEPTHHTYGTPPVRDDCWTTEEGASLLATVAHAKLLCVYTSTVEMGRLLAGDLETFRAFDAARRLGADNDTLDAILQPIRARIHKLRRRVILRKLRARKKAIDKLRRRGKRQ